MYSVHSMLDLRRRTIVFMDVLLLLLEVEEEVLLLVVEEEPLTLLLLVLVLCSYAAIANGFRFIPNLSIACRNDTAAVPPSLEDDVEVEVAVVSAADDDDDPLPLLFEEVDDRNGLPLLRRR